jgi:protein transport protein SEC61 subunit gamma-like protein
LDCHHGRRGQHRTLILSELRLNRCSHVPALMKYIKSKLKEYKRVLKITKKPDREEFVMSAKVTGLGILLIGLIGFIIFMIGTLFLPQ